ncbi:MAG: hypothetical protein HY231_14255 [Acidobacteria bacterium]|nr:hypothetical protein [Acidobacteriota bacterium]
MNHLLRRAVGVVVIFPCISRRRMAGSLELQLLTTRFFTAPPSLASVRLDTAFSPPLMPNPRANGQRHFHRSLVCSQANGVCEPGKEMQEALMPMKRCRAVFALMIFSVGTSMTACQFDEQR